MERRPWRLPVERGSPTIHARPSGQSPAIVRAKAPRAPQGAPARPPVGEDLRRDVGRKRVALAQPVALDEGDAAQHLPVIDPGPAVPPRDKGQGAPSARRSAIRDRSSAPPRTGGPGHADLAATTGSTAPEPGPSPHKGRRLRGWLPHRLHALATLDLVMASQPYRLALPGVHRLCGGRARGARHGAAPHVEGAHVRGRAARLPHRGADRGLPTRRRDRCHHAQRKRRGARPRPRPRPRPPSPAPRWPARPPRRLGRLGTPPRPPRSSSRRERRGPRLGLRRAQGVGRRRRLAGAPGRPCPHMATTTHRSAGWPMAAVPPRCIGPGVAVKASVRALSLGRSPAT